MAKKKEETEVIETKPAETEEKTEAGFYIADGKSVTSKKGILSSGKKVEAKFFNGGEDTIKALVASGHIVEKK